MRRSSFPQWGGSSRSVRGDFSKRSSARDVRKEGVHHFLKSVRHFFEVEKIQGVDFSLHCELNPSFVVRRTSTGNALLLVSSLVACVSKHSQNKKQKVKVLKPSQMA